MTDPQPSKRLVSYDRVAHIYDATRTFPPGVVESIADRLAALLPAPAPHLLEVGVGTGRVAVPLAARGVYVTGLDISRKMLGVLRSKQPRVEAVLAEASHPPFAPASFDGALFVHILHLVPDAEATVRATLRLVCPGGVLVSCRTEHTPTAAQQAGRYVDRVTRELTGASREEYHARYEDITALVTRLAAAASASFRESLVATWTDRITARETLDNLSRRVNSQHWDLSDAQIASIVRRVTPEVIRIFGGMDTPIESQASFHALVARLPGNFSGKRTI